MSRFSSRNLTYLSDIERTNWNNAYRTVIYVTFLLEFKCSRMEILNSVPIPLGFLITSHCGDCLAHLRVAQLRTQGSNESLVGGFLW